MPHVSHEQNIRKMIGNKSEILTRFISVKMSYTYSNNNWRQIFHTYLALK